MNWQEFIALLVLTMAMSFTPGPNSPLAIALASNGGLPQAMRFIVAVSAGWSRLLALSIAGLGTLVAEVPAVRGAIKGLGSGYLLWLGWALSYSSALSSADSGRLAAWRGVAWRQSFSTARPGCWRSRWWPGGLPDGLMRCSAWPSSCR